MSDDLKFECETSDLAKLAICQDQTSIRSLTNAHTLLCQLQLAFANQLLHPPTAQWWLGLASKLWNLLVGHFSTAYNDIRVWCTPNITSVFLVANFFFPQMVLTRLYKPTDYSSKLRSDYERFISIKVNNCSFLICIILFTKLFLE